MNSAIKSDTLSQKQSVLIVDSSAENTEVLQTALMRRGVNTLTARHAIEGANLVRQHHPDLIILDLEVYSNGNLKGTIPPFWAFWGQKNIPLLLLGTLRRNCPPVPGSEFVSKPYHYGPLIRKIEEMLSTAPRDVARQG